MRCSRRCDAGSISRNHPVTRRVHGAPVTRRLATFSAVGLLSVVVAGCLAGTDPSATPIAPPIPTTMDPTEPPSDPVTGRRPVIIDADFDHSDIAAIMILLRDPEVDVRAIAIDGTGLVHCQGGRLVARYLLDEFGLPDIPFGCGREAGGPDARPFPDEWRATADTGYGLDITPRVESGTPRDAVTVILEAVASSPVAPTIVALGPLTNLEDAFAADTRLPGRIAGIHAMLGTVDAPGNVHVDGFGAADPLEWNAFADPSAVAAVFASGVPITIVPLDATDDVPVPVDLVTRLGADHAAAGADLMLELLIRNPSRTDAGQGQQLWDELAALALTAPDLVTWRDATVVVGDGGRLTRDPGGRAVRFASAADRPAVEAALLEALRRGGPRATPFRMAGSLVASFDGSRCTVAVDSAGPGVHALGYESTAGSPSGVLIVGARPPHTWADIVAYLETIDLERTDAPPDWIHDAGGAFDEAGSGDRIDATMGLEAGEYGPICMSGEWPDLTLLPGEPFAIAE
jgi:inosine-uridine nucleoside N-ribohydrolase